MFISQLQKKALFRWICRPVYVPMKLYPFFRRTIQNSVDEPITVFVFIYTVSDPGFYWK